jgi:hypothetical protein
MADLFFLDADRVTRLPCPDERALRLDGDLVPVETAWQLAVVPFALAPRAPRRWALVAAPGTPVGVGAQRLHAGIVELHDRDRILVGDRELLFSTDALPVAVPSPAASAPCPVCCEALDTGGRTGLFRCGRCGMQACDRCWSLAPRRQCLTPRCGQPADFDRPLWTPAPEEFVTLAATGATP